MAANVAQRAPAPGGPKAQKPALTGAASRGYSVVSQAGLQAQGMLLLPGGSLDRSGSNHTCWHAAAVHSVVGAQCSYYELLLDSAGPC